MFITQLKIEELQGMKYKDVRGLRLHPGQYLYSTYLLAARKLENDLEYLNIEAQNQIKPRRPKNPGNLAEMEKIAEEHGKILEDYIMSHLERLSLDYEDLIRYEKEAQIEVGDKFEQYQVSGISRFAQLKTGEPISTKTPPVLEVIDIYEEGRVFLKSIESLKGNLSEELKEKLLPLCDQLKKNIDRKRSEGRVKAVMTMIKKILNT